VWYLAQEHLTLLHKKYGHFFFTIYTEHYGCIQNPFSAKTEMSMQELSLPVRKSILELRNDRTLRLKSSHVTL